MSLLRATALSSLVLWQACDRQRADCTGASGWSPHGDMA